MKARITGARNSELKSIWLRWVPASRVSNLRMWTHPSGTWVATGPKGGVYTNAFRHSGDYRLHASHSVLIEGLWRLGKISSDAYFDIKAQINEQHLASKLADSAFHLRTAAKVLGIKLTKAQEAIVKAAE